MNVAQIIRKARLSCDGILPGQTPSRMWQADELVDLLAESRDRIEAQLRLGRKNYGLHTVKYGDASFTRAGVTYVPSTSLAITAGAKSFDLPPDFAEVSKIQCLDNTRLRFSPGEYNSQYWIERELSSLQTDGTFISGGVADDTYAYDVTGERTLQFVPPALASMQLQVDYFPIKRLLIYVAGAKGLQITHGQTSATIAGGTLIEDGVYTLPDKQSAELISDVGTIDSSAIRLDREYPIIASIEDSAHFTLLQPWAGKTMDDGAYIIAMAPTLPVPVHRVIAQLMAALMFRKISSDIAAKMSGEIMGAFGDTIKPSTQQRQSQESRQTDDNELMGGLSG